ncbi:MAG: hypothetical protein QW374_06865 [Candidatus Bathyarchaeia archaeon]
MLRIDIAYRELTIPLENPIPLEAMRRGLARRSIVNGVVVMEVCIARIGVEVRSVMDGRCKVITYLGNDEIGYIIPEDNWAPGKYEESIGLGPFTASIMQMEIEKSMRI